MFLIQVASRELEEFMAEGLAKALPAKDWYVETYVKPDSDFYYKAYVLMIIDKSEADKALKEYCNQKAAEYQKQLMLKRMRKNASSLRKFQFFSAVLCLRLCSDFFRKSLCGGKSVFLY